MSFILDALKKSDKDRQRANVPSVQTMHAPHAAVVKTTYWPYLALIAVAMVGIGLFQWLKPQPIQVTISQAPMQATKNIITPKPLSSAPAIKTPAVPMPPDPGNALPVNESMSEPATTQRSDAPQPQEAATVVHTDRPEHDEHAGWIEISPRTPAENTTQDVVEGESVLPNVHALPPSVQRQLPTIAIAAQIYDSDPASRMALINGRSVREGGVIASGLVLETIGEDGIVLNFQGQRFHMDIFQNWSGN